MVIAILDLAQLFLAIGGWSQNVGKKAPEFSECLWEARPTNVIDHLHFGSSMRVMEEQND